MTTPEDEEREHKDAHLSIEFRSEGNRRRVLELAEEINNLSIRVHALEDHFEEGGIIQLLTDAVYRLGMAVEQLHGQSHNAIGSPGSSNERNAAADDAVRAAARSAGIRRSDA